MVTTTKKKPVAKNNRPKSVTGRGKITVSMNTNGHGGYRNYETYDIVSWLESEAYGRKLANSLNWHQRDWAIETDIRVAVWNYLGGDRIPEGPLSDFADSGFTMVDWGEIREYLLGYIEGGTY